MLFRQPKSTQQLIFCDTRYVSCAFFSLVVKMEALERKYLGGPQRFAERYTGQCNQDLMLVVTEAHKDLVPIAIELQNVGLFPGKEAFIFDATSTAMWLEKNKKIYLGVDWLEAHVVDNNVIAVRIEEGVII